MYILNTTFVVSLPAHGKWYEFATEKFIPSVKADTVFGDIRFTRLLSEEIEQHFTYSLQIDCKDMQAYQHYMQNVLPEYTEFSKMLFDSEVMHFISLLKLIDTK